MATWKRFTYCDVPGCKARSDTPKRDGWEHMAGRDWCLEHCGKPEPVKAQLRPIPAPQTLIDQMNRRAWEAGKDGRWTRDPITHKLTWTTE